MTTEPRDRPQGLFGHNAPAHGNPVINGCKTGKLGVVRLEAIEDVAVAERCKGAVECMARALKPGGRFVVEFGGKGNVDHIVRACQDVFRKHYNVVDCPNPWYFPSIAEYTTLLEQHGIEVTRADLYDRPTPLQDGNKGLSNWIRMFGGQFLEYLKSEDEIADFLARVSSQLETSPLYDGTQWTADYRRIRLVGQKLP